MLQQHAACNHRERGALTDEQMKILSLSLAAALAVTGAAAEAVAEQAAAAAAAEAAQARVPPAGCWEPGIEPGVNSVALGTIPTPQHQPLPPHPRLRLNDAQLQQMNATISSDANARSYFEGMHARGVQMLAEPLVECDSGNDASRGALQVQYTLGLLWRLTGDDRFAARAVRELVHVTTDCTMWDPFGLGSRR